MASEKNGNSATIIIWGAIVVLVTIAITVFASLDTRIGKVEEAKISVATLEERMINLTYCVNELKTDTNKKLEELTRMVSSIRANRHQ